MLLTELAKPTLPVSPPAQVTDDQLDRFAELIYQRTGIRVSPQKKTLLSNRLRRRLRKTESKDFGDYYKHLRRLRPRDPQWDSLLEELTTHETYLFRDELQWDWFRNGFLKQLAAEAETGRAKRSLRIWSAACSTGDEAITAACCIAASLVDLGQWTIRILASDIAGGALEQARSAVFGERAMRLVPEPYRRRFFSKAAGARIWQAKPVLSEMISFRRQNLASPLREKPFDLVLLKNVLIYFDTASKKKVLDNVRAAIRPNGLLLVGTDEGVAELVGDFRQIQPWLYRKPS